MKYTVMLCVFEGERCARGGSAGLTRDSACVCVRARGLTSEIVQEKKAAVFENIPVSPVAPIARKETGVSSGDQVCVRAYVCTYACMCTYLGERE